MRIELSSFVEDDLDAIAQGIAQDDPARVSAFLREIGATIRRVGDKPLRYPLQTEIGDGARLAVAGHFVILFRIAKGLAVEMVRIERIVLGGRELAATKGGKDEA